MTSEPICGEVSTMGDVAKRVSVAKGICQLRFNDSVVDWIEYGDYTSLSDSFVIACDGSGADMSGPMVRNDVISVAGAAVDPDGRWWGWRAGVRSRVARRSSTWAECVTLLISLRIAPTGGVVYSDCDAAIALARSLSSKKLHTPMRGNALDAVKENFGGFPAFPRGIDYADSQYYSGMALHGNAHRLAALLRAGAGFRSWSFEQHCAALAHSWWNNAPGGVRLWMQGHRYCEDEQRWFSNE